MNPSDSSLFLDENLARLLAAYDQGFGEADGKGSTVGLEEYPAAAGEASPQPKRPSGPPSPRPLNEGSAGDLLPDLSASQTPMPGYSGIPGPHRIGRFELRRQLGKGGCGIVFLAYDPKLKREVALKLPRPEMLLSPDARRRLLREAHAAAEFDHPNLVPVYETGEIGPLCFIATAFCPGQTLAEWLDRQAFPVPVRQAARLVAQIADAIQHAHDRGVLHRDMKPNNVILQETKADPNDVGPPPGSCLLCGDHFIPRVVDFGLAKLSERGPSETASRQILGTPKYMAPEQAQARHDDIGPQADVYALGVILYELLTGRAPYEGASDVEVLRLAIEGNLTPPRNIRLDIPRDLEAICLKAMARAPAKRYRTAIDLADDLRRFLDGLPTLARPLNRIGRAGRWLRRNDQIVALAVVSVIAIVFLSVGLWTAYQSELIRTDRDNIRAAQDGRARMDRQYEYARDVRDAFFAWRAGDSRQMTDSLTAAQSVAALNQELPDFAWGYLSQLARIEHTALACPAGPVLALAISPQGDRFATGHPDGTVALWVAASGAPLGSTRAHTGAITHLTFVKGGSAFVTAGAEPSARAWTITSRGEVLPAADIPKLGTVGGLALSDGGREALIVNARGQVVFWASGEVVGEIPASARPRTLAWLPGNDGGRVAIADEAGLVSIHDRHGRLLHQFSVRESPVVCMAASPGGTDLALGGEDGSVCIRDATTGAIRTRIYAHLGPVRQVRFGPDGQTLYAAGEDGIVRILNRSIEMQTGSIRELPGSLTAAAVSSEGRAHSIALADGSVLFYPNWNSSPRRLRTEGGAPIRVLRYGVPKDLLGVEIAGAEARVWSLSERPAILLGTRSASGAAITAADLSRDAAVLALGDQNGRVAVWSLTDRESLGSFDSGLAEPVRHLAVSDDGRWIAALSSGGVVGVWEAGKPERMFSVAGHGSGLWTLRFLPGGERLVTAGQGSSIKVWSIASGHEEMTLLGHTGRITALNATPDGKTLVSGSGTGEIKCWDLRTGQELFGLRRHGEAIHVAEFGGSGSVLLTGVRIPGGRSEIAFWEAGKE